MKNMLIVTVTLLLFLAPPAAAQDESILWEHLQMFPADLNYTFIAHADLEVVRNSTEYPMVKYIETQTGKMSRNALMMPDLFNPQLNKNIESMTMVHYNKTGETLIYFDQEPSPDTMHSRLMEMKNRGESVMGNATKIDDPQAQGRFVYKVPVFEGDTVTIVSSPDLKALISAALKTGYFKKTGSTYKEKPAFSLNQDTPSGEKTFQVVQYNQQSLIVYSRPDSLRIIETTESEVAQPLTEKEEFADLLDVISDFTPMFRVQITEEVRIQKAIERINNNLKMTRQEKKQRIDQLLSTQLFLVNGIQTNREMMLRSVMIFRNKELAKKMEAEMKFRVGNPQDNKFKEIAKRARVTRDDNRVEVSVPIDMQLARMQIKISKEHLKEIEAESKKRRQEAEERKTK